MVYRRVARAIRTSMPGYGKVNVLVGGDDAPMGPRDVRFFKMLFAAAVVVGAALLVLALTE